MAPPVKLPDNDTYAAYVERVDTYNEENPNDQVDKLAPDAWFAAPVTPGAVAPVSLDTLDARVTKIERRLNGGATE